MKYFVLKSKFTFWYFINRYWIVGLDWRFGWYIVKKLFIKIHTSQKSVLLKNRASQKIVLLKLQFIKKSCISNFFGPNSKTCIVKVRAAWGRVSRGLTVQTAESLHLRLVLSLSTKEYKSETEIWQLMTKLWCRVFIRQFSATFVSISTRTTLPSLSP